MQRKEKDRRNADLREGERRQEKTRRQVRRGGKEMKR